MFSGVSGNGGMGLHHPGKRRHVSKRRPSGCEEKMGLPHERRIGGFEECEGPHRVGLGVEGMVGACKRPGMRDRYQKAARVFGSTDWLT